MCVCFGAHMNMWAMHLPTVWKHEKESKIEQGGVSVCMRECVCALMLLLFGYPLCLKPHIQHGALPQLTF